MKALLTAKQIDNAIDRLYAAMAADLPPQETPIALVGLRTRGEILARRLADRLAEEQPERTVHFGILDITFYRDDLARHRGQPLVRATELDFDLTDLHVILVDDVLQTGRSIRAALQVLTDFGRPAIIRLGVLVNRGGHEMPIAPDYVGKTMTVPQGQRIQIALEEQDGQEGAYSIKKESDA